MPLTQAPDSESFLIEAAIGAGGMSEVYKAKNTGPGRTVAITLDIR